MEIRQERPDEYGAIYELVKTAFLTAEVADGDEQDYMEMLRSGDGYNPELALVADDEGRLAGHIMLTGACVEDGDGVCHDVLVLSPLSVALEYRNRGVGATLVRAALGRAREAGYRAAFLTGNPDYYSRFGFSESAGFGIGNNLGVPDKFSLACELVPGALGGIRGTIIFRT